MIENNYGQMIAAFCKAKLDLENARLSDEYYYVSLPLCVTDAVFSIGVNYESTRNVVTRFCKHFDIESVNRQLQPQSSAQLSMMDFIKIYDKYSVSRMADEIYCNHQRTSTRGGLLKSEAVLRFSQALVKHQVNYRQDINKVIGSSDFEQDIKQIPGQKSGISLRYFYMLAGSDDYIKPDRMVLRFIYSALNQMLTVEESCDVISKAHSLLVQEHPHLTLRSLDHLIWNYQRTAKPEIGAVVAV